MLWTAMMFSGLALADGAWATREVPLLRWPPAVMADAPETATAQPGQALTVVLEDGDLVRVQLGEDFGWVPADALTDQAPSEPPAAGGDEPAETDDTE